jgi:uncharacterized protein
MHGICHVDIPTTNFKKTKKFLGKVFNWTFTDVPEMDYVLFQAGAAPHGGLFEVKKMPKRGQVGVYIEVEDIDVKLKEIKKAKGKVLLKKSPVGEMGWMAQFATPDGCTLALWQTRPGHPEAKEPAPAPAS